ncbi:lupus La protein homolog [Mizuhopecten yessoensis]|uniref:Lupus La protein-like n=1 Tax=Mizuhopecten yessoensis TaxID=6573 RepID=A0A210Q009_MIZYE|nr:lupus La protein homolog [Mizuhopecten yessoensis]OWF42081.1 Lupus La protein-like [Mizuhopecten yessoensis]
MATAEGDSEMNEVKQTNSTTEQTKETNDGDNVNGKVKEEEDDQVKETIGTYAVIPEDPPLPPLGPPNNLEKKIIKQLEYYFGDMNLPRDRFLQEQIREDSDGWVSLAIMTKFNRLKQLTSNLKMIATAIRKSDSGFLEVSKDGVYMRRSPDKPLPENTEDRRSEIAKKTVYAKGFPTNMALDKIISFFEEHGPMDTVFMRRDINKKFKGSVFAVFQSQSDADKFLAAAEIKFQDTLLKRMSKQLYFSQKQEEKKKIKQEQNLRKKEESTKREAEDREKLKDSITKGTVLHVSGIKGEETEREDLKNYFSDFGTIAWVDFDRGDNEAWVRFEGDNKAVEGLQAALDANENKIMIKEDEVTCDVLEGDAELEHWRKIFSELAERRAQNRQGKKRGASNWRGPKDKRRKESKDDAGGDAEGGDSDDDE